MKNLVGKIAILGFIIASLVLKEKYMFGPVFPDKDNKFYIYLYVVASIVLIWTMFLRFKTQILTLTIIDFIIYIIFIGDVLYMRYYGELLSFYMIPQAKYIKDINSSILSLLNYGDLIVFLDIVVLAILFAYLVKYKKGVKRMKIYISLPIAIIILTVGFLEVNKKIVDNKDILTHKWDNKYVAREMGVLYYHYNDLKEYLTDEFSKLAYFSRRSSRNIG